mmetsp:Transcript_86064/g.136722  ORF Transcript_86064/g.136722 Transcript_86064/m.136722 type:complete len:110 (-) Transcript_86064:190-519(-)
MERLFSHRLIGAVVPCERLLKRHVSKEQWQTWNRTLDLLDVEDQEKFRTPGTSDLLPFELHELLLRAVTKDAYSLNRTMSKKSFWKSWSITFINRRRKSSRWNGCSPID